MQSISMLKVHCAAIIIVANWHKMNEISLYRVCISYFRHYIYMNDIHGSNIYIRDGQIFSCKSHTQQTSNVREQQAHNSAFVCIEKWLEFTIADIARISQEPHTKVEEPNAAREPWFGIYNVCTLIERKPSILKEMTGE